MANQRRVPATRRIPKVELLEIECRAVSIIRDNSGKILGKGRGTVYEIHTVEEFAEYLENCKKEAKEANKQA